MEALFLGAALCETVVLNLDSAYSAYGLSEWPLLTIAIFGAYAVLNRLLVMPSLFFWAPTIETRGKRLEDDELTLKDYAFVAWNEFVTAFYVIEVARLLKHAEWIVWGAENVTALNTVGAVLLCVAAYDFVYVPFHRALHIPAIYPYVHKHHHHQLSPFRGTWDGINTHPIEFVIGEFLHIGALYMASFVLPRGLHVYAVAFFLLAAGLMASLNHTRWGVRVPLVYDARDHDVHHRFPRQNYGQFVMWWDRLYGSFRPYDRAHGTQQATQKKQS